MKPELIDQNYFIEDPDNMFTGIPEVYLYKYTYLERPPGAIWYGELIKKTSDWTELRPRDFVLKKEVYSILKTSKKLPT